MDQTRTNSDLFGKKIAILVNHDWRNDARVIRSVRAAGGCFEDVKCFSKLVGGSPQNDNPNFLHIPGSLYLYGTNEIVLALKTIFHFWLLAFKCLSRERCKFSFLLSDVFYFLLHSSVFLFSCGFLLGSWIFHYAANLYLFFVKIYTNCNYSSFSHFSVLRRFLIRGSAFISPSLHRSASRVARLDHLIRAYFILPFLYLILYRIDVGDKIAKFSPDVILAHDLVTLPCAVLVARKCGARVIYDAHELEVDTNYDFSFFMNVWIKIAERVCISKADQVLTVCDSISKFLFDRYGLKKAPTVIYNTPTSFEKRSSKVSLNSVRTMVGVNNDSILAVYVGLITKDRGLDFCLDSLVFLPNLYLALVGPSDSATKEKLMEKAKSMGIEKRVFFLPAVPPDQVVHFISDADLSLVTIENVCLSYYYAFPNKLLESVIAGLPVVGSSGVEIRALIDKWKLGIVVDELDGSHLATAIKEVAANRSVYMLSEENLQLLKGEFGWDKQLLKMQTVFKLVV